MWMSTRLGNRLDEKPKGTCKVERAAVRVGIPVLLSASAVGALAVSLHTTRSAIPSFAFGSHAVLAVQVAVLFFYGALLLLVPLARALFDGDLPVELSLRGARWSESIESLGDDIADRQEKAEAEALSADLEIQQEIEELRGWLNEIHSTQGADSAEAFSRITVLEERMESEKAGG
jgi:uncharacterized membrane protein